MEQSSNATPGDGQWLSPFLLDTRMRGEDAWKLFSKPEAESL